VAHYDVTAGTDTVSQAQFTEVYNQVNKVFSDLYPNAVSTSLGTNCATYTFGWGNRKSKQFSKKITHKDWNQLIVRINIALIHTGYTLVSGGNTVTLVTRGETIAAAHYNALADASNEIITKKIDTGITGNKIYTTRSYANYLDSAQAELSALTTATRTDSWQTQIITELRLSFSDFDDVRYFFNAGCDVRITPSTTGATTAAGIEWANIIAAIGTFYYNIDGPNYTGTTGTLYWLPFCDLTSEYQLAFISGVGSSGYGGYSGYSGYSGASSYSAYSSYSGYSMSQRVKIYVKVENNLVSFKIVYIGTGNIIDGTQNILFQLRSGADIANRGIKHHTTKPSWTLTNNMDTLGEDS
jgi:hypothetical protein